MKDSDIKFSRQYQVYDSHLDQWRDDSVAVEEPLQISLKYDDKEFVLSITMRTPGDDRQLIIGFLFSESIIKSLEEIINITPSVDHQGLMNSNEWLIELTGNVPAWILNLSRHQMTHSSCGVCGKTSIQSLELKSPPSINRDNPIISQTLLSTLNSKINNYQLGFSETGGMHACALFEISKEILSIKEDVGRHNALDKLVGFHLENGQLPANDHILWLSGRISYEMVQKAIMAGVAIIVAVGAPTHLAVETARRFGITLIGFNRNDRFNIYNGHWRLTN
ncbi:formate dehydrogenase accessory sulfurtransferase FdhD [Pleionea sediminis]|uniref:formate dehydrogenase accessory sulfurtransferase FdhD n=1 Tax=Pleionea sediminis TaxID=2569479 RepID=UPI0013DD985F|nr:formate dehydrogenase accessory sulfurtransferase FdhD [Pleionea sediminis]